MVLSDVLSMCGMGSQGQVARREAGGNRRLCSQSPAKDSSDDGMECAGEGGRRPFRRRIALNMLQSMPPLGAEKQQLGSQYLWRFVTIISIIISFGDDAQHSRVRV